MDEVKRRYEETRDLVKDWKRWNREWKERQLGDLKRLGS